ncbi:MAG: efflux RND transporter periplasmic adaptor subunit [Planctomycetes bacterium]|nr:efflux RND transporter periplasmic adaptor subunit [Planctomycetota bacterium]
MDLQSLKIDRSPPPPHQPRRAKNPWPLRAALLLAAGGALWLFWPSLSGFADRLRLPQVRTHLVTAAAPAAAAAVRGTAANGYIVAARRAALSSDVPGRIVEMRVREGSQVQRGDIVARLFADEYRAALQRAEADLVTAKNHAARAAAAAAAAAVEVQQADGAAAAAEAQRRQAVALQKYYALQMTRVQALAQQGINTLHDLDKAQSDLDGAAAQVDSATAGAAAAASAADAARSREQVAKADIEVATAQAAAAKAARDLAQATLDKTDVRAPFDGIVVLKDAEVGEVVSPNSQGGSNARGAVCTLVDFASLEVQANVPETALASVQIGGAADVFLDACPDRRYAGVVDRVWPTADRQKATVEVRVRLEQKDDHLRPEMGVRVVFRDAGTAAPTAADAAAARILVPEPAIVGRDGKQGAFVLEGDVVRFATVAAGERKNGRIAIDAGLTENQRIVLDPPASLQNGDRVRRVDD